MSLAYAIQADFEFRPRRRGRAARPPAGRGSTLRSMAVTAARDRAALAVEEARLARAAAAGDGSAFAALYERYERRAYNLAYRIAGSEDDAADAVQEAFLSVMRRLPKLGDRELEFGSYLFAATRNACYDLMRARRRAQPSDAIPESAAPLGSGAGGLGLDPGDPEDDPDRKQLLASQQDEIREANGRLPERQREALALRELEELSYDEIAAAMEMNRNSVAQLISRARINLRDELRGTALAAVAASSPECERALPLIAMRDDGQLDGDSGDAAWLDTHLAGCDRCRLGVEAMQEAGASYRAWAPIAAAPLLFEETMAKAAALAGADWSEEIAKAREHHDPASLPGMPSAYLTGYGDEGGASRRRRAIVAAALALLLLGAGLAALPGGDDPSPAPARPAPARAQPAAGAEVPAASPSRRGMERRATTEATPAAPSSSAAVPVEAQTGTGKSAPKQSPAPPAGESDLKPTQATAAPKPKPVPPPVTEEPPAAEEPAPEEPPRDPSPPPAGTPGFLPRGDPGPRSSF